jgi:hypothetical protein
MLQSDVMDAVKHNGDEAKMEPVHESVSVLILNRLANILGRLIKIAWNHSGRLKSER